MPSFIFIDTILVLSLCIERVDSQEIPIDRRKSIQSIDSASYFHVLNLFIIRY